MTAQELILKLSQYPKNKEVRIETYHEEYLLPPKTVDEVQGKKGYILLKSS